MFSVPIIIVYFQCQFFLFNLREKFTISSHCRTPMGPKKKITSSTPAVKNPSTIFGGLSDNSGPSSIDESSANELPTVSVNESSSFAIGNEVEVAQKLPSIPKVSTWKLICKAIDTIGVPKKGASYLAIQKWIINNKENVQTNKLKVLMKKAIEKALESGLLKRPRVSKNVTGLRGFFILSKPTSTQTTKALRGKTKTKPKTATAPKPKAAVKPKSDTEEAAQVKQKTKVGKTKPTEEAAQVKQKAKVVKTKPTEEAAQVKPKTKVGKTKPTEEAAQVKPKAKVEKTKPTEEVAQVKQKTKVVKTKPTEEATSAKPKVVKSNPDTKKASNAKRKTEVVKTKTGEKSVPSDKENAAVKSNSGKDRPKATALKPILDRDDLPVSKPRALRARVNGVKLPTQKELNSVQHQLQNDNNQITIEQKKVTKNTSKTTNGVKDGSKSIRPRKLYSSRLKTGRNIPRKDVSDTEINAKPGNRKSLKSYSSDTEVDIIKRKKVAKSKKNAQATNTYEAGS